MTLEEAIRRFLDIQDERREIMSVIEQNHIHTQNDELVYNRYKNTANISIRAHIYKYIEEGHDCYSLLEDLPLPDRPFTIEDVEDKKAVEYYKQMIELDKEENQIKDYIQQNFDNEIAYQKAMELFNEKYSS